MLPPEKPYSLAEAGALLTAPGAPFEMEQRVIRDVPVRIWKKRKDADGSQNEMVDLA
jgi:hypothetical protein